MVQVNIAARGTDRGHLITRKTKIVLMKEAVLKRDKASTREKEIYVRKSK
jgi:hypothetical protein